MSNSFDEESPKVSIEIKPKEVSMEDWGKGIEEIESFVMFGQATKAEAAGEKIGEKGLGKLSLLRVGKNVTFLTNNGETGLSILMTPEYFDCDTKSAARYLDHRGTKIIIPNPVEVPIIPELQKYLARAFGLRIARGSVITVNGLDLAAKSGIETEERLVCRLKGGADVTGNIKEDTRGHGVLDVYIKHVFVQSVVIDPERKFSGWVNCNGLKPTTARNDILKNDLYEDFLGHLRQFCSKFPKMEEGISKENILLGNELDRMLRDYLKEMKILPTGLMLTGQGNEPSPTKHERVRGKKRHKEPSPPGPGGLHTLMKTDKNIKRTIRSSTGIQWVDAHLGNDSEPIFYDTPNTIYRNLTNDIFKFASKKKVSLGPSWLRIMPYFARTVIQLNPDYQKWTPKQVNLETDKAVRYFLRSRGQLEGIC